MFQKMSEEEIERRSRLRADTSDAEVNRRNIVLGRDNQRPSAEESFHPTTDKEFKQRYGGSLYQENNNNPTQTGPTNVAVEKREYHGNKNKRKRVGMQNGESQPEASQANNSGVWSMIRKSATAKSNTFAEEARKGIKEKTLDIYGSSMGRGLIASAYAWTNFIYLTFQIWLGIIAVVAIGIIFAIEYYVGSGVTQAAFDTIMASIGVDWDFYLVALLCYMLVVTVCYVQLFGVAMQAKALGLHPLGGRGAFLKTGTFLLCFILYWVPIINCLPLVNLYIFSIQAYPR